MFAHRALCILGWQVVSLSIIWGQNHFSVSDWGAVAHELLYDEHVITAGDPALRLWHCLVEGIQSA
jgi:hypothetical protein